MGKRWHRKCDGAQCRDNTFFRSLAPAPAGDPFFKPVSGADVPVLQKQEAAGTEEEKKDPVTEGAKKTAEQLVEHEAFKKWYEPKLGQLKYTMWDKATPDEKAVMLTFLGVNLGLAATMFGLSPQVRSGLSDVNIGALAGLAPYSPIKGFKYKQPGPGKTATDFSADFTFNPYLDLWKNRPGFLPSGATFGLESSYDPGGKRFNVTGGKFGLDFLGGGLKAEGKTFNSLSPYPMLMPGRDGMPPGWLMQEYPGMPNMKTGPGFQFTLNADLLKISPWLRKYF